MGSASNQYGDGGGSVETPSDAGRPKPTPTRVTKSVMDTYTQAAAKENKSRAASGGQQTTPKTSAQGSTPAPTSSGSGTGADIASGLAKLTHPTANIDRAVSQATN